jgi:hypothetical protein
MESNGEFQTTTVRLPKRIYEEARAAVKESKAASSINDFLVQAVEQRLKQLRDREIDAAFAKMADDPEYQRDAVTLAQSFEGSDWSAYQTLNPSRETHGRSRSKAASAKTKAR